jgi:hypothetical protein
MEHFKGYEWFPQYIRGHIHSDETLFWCNLFIDMDILLQ